MHSRYWIGALPVAVAAWTLFFLMARLWEGLAMREALVRGFVFGGMALLSWAIGIWASFAADPDEEDGEEEPEFRIAGPPAVRWVVRIVVVAGCLALVCSSQIEALVRGEVVVARAVAGMVLKLSAVALVLFPSLWNSRNA